MLNTVTPDLRPFFKRGAGASIQLYMVPGMDHCQGGVGTDTGAARTWIRAFENDIKTRAMTTTRALAKNGASRITITWHLSGR